MKPVDRPSPNFDARPDGVTPDLVVLHYTDMESADIALARLCDPAAKVSAHYLIDEDGSLYRLVDEKDRAWHGGLSFWDGVRNVNGVSIGIELQNRGHQAGLPDYPQALMATLTDLLKDIQARYAIPADRIVGHSDIAPDRKIDPGEHFPWDRLATAGLAQAAPDNWQTFDPIELPAALHRLGYDPEVEASVLLEQFCRRWARWGVTPDNAGKMAAALLA